MYTYSDTRVNIYVCFHTHTDRQRFSVHLGFYDIPSQVWTRSELAEAKAPDVGQHSVPRPLFGPTAAVDLSSKRKTRL